MSGPLHLVELRRTCLYFAFAGKVIYNQFASGEKKKKSLSIYAYLRPSMQSPIPLCLALNIEDHFPGIEHVCDWQQHASGSCQVQLLPSCLQGLCIASGWAYVVGPTMRPAFFYLSSATVMIAQASVLQKYAKSLVFSVELSHVFVGPAVVVFSSPRTCPEIRLRSPGGTFTQYVVILGCF